MKKNTIPKVVIDGAIIAGGLGTRMNGQDKGLLEFQEARFAERIARILRPAVRHLIINCNRNQAIYREIADTIVGDEPRQTECGKQEIPYEGPLAGILAVLNVTDADYVLFTPCDTPNLPTDYAKRLCTVLEQSESRPTAVIATDGERWHPLHLLLSVSTRDSLHTYLENGGRKVIQWLEQQPHELCTFSDEKQGFFNVNSGKDLEALRAL